VAEEEEEGEKKKMVGENGKGVEYEEKDECLSFHLGQSNFNLLCLGTKKRRTPTMNLFTWNDPKALAVFVTGSCMVEFLYALNLHKNKNKNVQIG